MISNEYYHLMVELIKIYDKRLITKVASSSDFYTEIFTGGEYEKIVLYKGKRNIGTLNFKIMSLEEYVIKGIEENNYTREIVTKDHESVNQYFESSDHKRDDQVLYVDLIQIDSDFKGLSAFKTLIDGFIDMYNEKYYGYKIGADFANHKFQEVFEKFIDKYKHVFPEGTNVTRKIPEFEDKEQFDFWQKSMDERNFSINRDDELENLPEIYKKTDNTIKNNNPQSGYYKNITIDEFNAVNSFMEKYSSFIEKYNGNAMGIAYLDSAVCDGDDIYMHNNKVSVDEYPDSNRFFLSPYSAYIYINNANNFDVVEKQINDLSKYYPNIKNLECYIVTITYNSRTGEFYDFDSLISFVNRNKKSASVKTKKYRFKKY